MVHLLLAQNDFSPRNWIRIDTNKNINKYIHQMHCINGVNSLIVKGNKCLKVNKSIYFKKANEGRHLPR